MKNLGLWVLFLSSKTISGLPETFGKSETRDGDSNKRKEGSQRGVQNRGRAHSIPDTGGGGEEKITSQNTSGVDVISVKRKQESGKTPFGTSFGGGKKACRQKKKESLQKGVVGEDTISRLSEKRGSLERDLERREPRDRGGTSKRKKCDLGGKKKTSTTTNTE